MTTEPQPSPWQSLVTGTTRAGTNLLTFPLGVGQLLAHGIQAVTPLKMVPGRDEAATNLLGAINHFTRFGTAEPTDLTHQAIEATPSILTNPGLLHKALGVAQFGITHGGEISRELKSEASQAAEGYGTAAAGGEAQPLAVPQGPQALTASLPSPSPEVGSPTPSSSSIRFRGRSAGRRLRHHTHSCLLLSQAQACLRRHTGATHTGTHILRSTDWL
jgi:hypothetical protein